MPIVNFNESFKNDYNKNRILNEAIISPKGTINSFAVIFNRDEPSNISIVINPTNRVDNAVLFYHNNIIIKSQDHITDEVFVCKNNDIDGNIKPLSTYVSNWEEISIDKCAQTLEYSKSNGNAVIEITDPFIGCSTVDLNKITKGEELFEHIAAVIKDSHVDDDGSYIYYILDIKNQKVLMKGNCNIEFYSASDYINMLKEEKGYTD